MSTIFKEIKEACNVNQDDNGFDVELKIYLSTISAILYQLGVGTEPVEFTDTLTWEELNVDKHKEFALVKAYVLIKNRLYFDPPAGTTLSYQQEAVKELEWRIKEAYTGGWTAVTEPLEVVDE